MDVRFNADFFTGNREKLRKLFAGTAPIVLTANGLLQRGTDVTFSLYQDRNFWYLTGIDVPDAILVLDKAKEYLILSEEHDHRVRFDGAKTAAEITQLSGIAEVLDYKKGYSLLKSRLKKVKYVATLAASPSYVPYYGFYSNPARTALIEKVKAINANVELLDLKQHFVTLRAVKQLAEIEAIQSAIDITQKAITTVVKKTWSLKTTESELANELDYNFRKLGANGIAFDSIVAVGPNSSVIHHTPDQTPLLKTGLVLFDVGAEVNHYAADISRVYKVGRTSKRVQQVYEAVQDSLREACARIKPGLVHKQFEEDMEHVVGEKLRELGLIRSIDRKSVRRYFPTYTSHHLGLDPHDLSDYNNPLAVNNVLAVEPGIYIPEEGIGIRIEENVLITEDGIKLMSSGLSPELVSLKLRQE